MDRGLRLPMPGMQAFLALAVVSAAALWSQPADPPLIVTGTLLDEHGTPAADVEVTLRPYPSAYAIDLDLLGEADALPEPADRALTRPDGTFSLSAPTIGPYRLEIRPNPPTDKALVTVPLVYRDILPLRVPLHLEPIELPARHLLTVRALGPNGQPIAGAFVVVEAISEQPADPPYREAHEQPERLHPEFDRASMLAGAEGLARFLMPASKARVAVAAAGFAHRVATVTGLPSSETPTAEILAWSDTSFRGATPDSEGRFELMALAPGTWRLIASAGDRRSVAQSLTLEPGAAGASVELRFEPGFRLTGQVLIAGEPASGGFVTALLKKRLGPKDRLRIRTDHQGRFDVEGLPPGTYELEFGHREGTRQEQPLDLQSDHYNLLVNLQPRPAKPK